MDTIASAFGSLFGKKDNKRNSSIGPEVKQPQIPDSSPIVVKSEKERIGTFQSLWSEVISGRTEREEQNLWIQIYPTTEG